MLSTNERKRFDAVLDAVIESLPEDILAYFDEVPLVVEDEPSPELLEEMRIDLNGEPPDLCGLHSGVPLSERTVFESSGLPEQILIFRGPILRLAETQEELEQEVRVTLLHELGHHFGLSEERLEQLGYD